MINSGDRMEVKEAMNKGVITINSSIEPFEAFQKMYQEGVRRLFVIDDAGEPIGVVSYSDLIGLLGSVKPAAKGTVSIKIRDLMSKDIITISAADGIEDAANLMLRADISGLLVLEDQKPVGVITKTDICRLVAAEFLVPF
jgi:predicted transcriptional regulator